MRHVTCAAWRSHHEKRHTIAHSNTLQSLLTISSTRIFNGEQIAIKKIFQVSAINFVIGKIELSFAFIPSVYGECICLLYMRQSLQNYRGRMWK
jgi:hypothetical protein